jgi:threonyl-tRNA synthetase
VQQLRQQGVRVSADISAQRMNAKIRQAQLMKVPYMLVVGEEEMQAGKVALRVRDGSQQKDLALVEFAGRVKDKIARRAPEL